MAKHPDIWSFDSGMLSEKVRLIAGADEVGRGALAGPLVASALILKEGAKIPGLADSKTLKIEQRESIYDIILSNVISISIVCISPREIDSYGLHKMNIEALKLAILGLEPSAHLNLVDGFAIEMGKPCARIIKGDARSASIAAASIVAKVNRDRLMKKLHQSHPEYGFASHFGYATAEHLGKLAIHGPSSVHRLSFSGVRADTAFGDSTPKD